MSWGYAGSISDFLSCDEDKLIGCLIDGVAAAGIAVHRTLQVDAWREEIRILKVQLRDPVFHDWFIIMEYEIPRRSHRPDVILINLATIFVIEFKIGATGPDAEAVWQAQNYALDLRDFHAQSYGRTILPVLCATGAPERPGVEVKFHGSPTRLSEVICTSRTELGERLLLAATEAMEQGTSPVELQTWLNSAYRPTPNIVEAAVRLYEKHGVREISHRYAHNLDATTAMVVREIEASRRLGRRVVCFVTGVPGAGKTLTGLEVVHDPNLRGGETAAGVFLSGNGPLVKVLREALLMDQMRKGNLRRDCEHEVRTFVQNVHNFLRYHREQPDVVPHEHVVVFDEAQRAWDKDQMWRKRKLSSSEATQLLEIMERLPDWSVVVALVGGGQEIFSGEAGLEEWGRALAARSVSWDVVASPEVLSGGASVAGHRLFPEGIPSYLKFRQEPLAHLNVSVRSHRAQRWAEWVNALLALRVDDARALFPEPREFPCVVTRDLDHARLWLRSRGGHDSDQRVGLVATSEDQRLRAHGIEGSSAFRIDYPFDKWFLMPPADVRSSFMLEVAASEFECQGLELDWVGVCWGGDLIPTEDSLSWEHRRFRGTGWQNVRKETEQAYARNRYRVLLTRARRGMVIWVPPGSSDDPTRDAVRFDRLYATLRRAGVPDLEGSWPT